MNDTLNELRARQIVQTMQRARNEVDLFATHARTLRLASNSIDALLLFQEADRLVRSLMSSRAVFEEAASHTTSLSRSLSSRPNGTGGPPPAAKWGNEFRAGSKQFIEAVRRAEKELSELYAEANEKMSSVTRTSTGDPKDALDILMTFVEALARWVERRRVQKA
jgi:hypothetical protein